MKDLYKCRKSAYNSIEAYLSGRQKSLKTLAWNIKEIAGAGLTKENFEHVLASFGENPRIEEIRTFIEERDVFGNFKGTLDLL